MLKGFICEEPQDWANLRLLPGAHVLARISPLEVCKAEDNGFEVRDCISHYYPGGQEEWWLLRKPLDGTVAANILKYSCGALNIDESRVGIVEGTRKTKQETSPTGFLNRGRWPSNLLFFTWTAV